MCDLTAPKECEDVSELVLYLLGNFTHPEKAGRRRDRERSAACLGDLVLAAPAQRAFFSLADGLECAPKEDLTWRLAEQETSEKIKQATKETEV